MKIVASRDGTLIACEQGGRGSHLVIVHGTSSNSSRWEAVRHRLEEHFTVARMDRRGRGFLRAVATAAMQLNVSFGGERESYLLLPIIPAK